MHTYRSPALVAIAGLLWMAESSACSPLPGWRPPDAVEAFAQAGFVVRGVVESVRRDSQDSVAKLKDVRVLKGKPFPDFEVRTTSSAMCGIDSFVIGREYVLFLDSPRSHVMFTSQPKGSVQSTLSALKVAKLVD